MRRMGGSMAAFGARLSLIAVGLEIFGILSYLWSPDAW